ncbi:MAG: hypothetical protein Q8L65_07885 [Burkholderiales bacterium]|nr:hypothetical protein [Burkholderiales bacterium]MDP2397751.1 hypothetical protein [Burkholderiales bacterium]
MKKTILLKTFLLFVMLSVTAPSWAITATGPTNCGGWVKDRKEGKGLAWQREAWLAGYLSGLAIGTGIEFWNKGGNLLSPESVFLWMDNYCQANPLKNTFDGGLDLFHEHTKK